MSTELTYEEVLRVVGDSLERLRAAMSPPTAFFTLDSSSPDPSEVPTMSTELTYEEVLRVVGDNLTVLADALEKEVSETRCACCDQRTFQPLDKSRALEQIHGMLEKVNRFSQAAWAKTVVP